MKDKEAQKKNKLRLEYKTDIEEITQKGIQEGRKEEKTEKINV